MRKNPGRKERRRNLQEGRPGDLSRSATHRMRTHDGMIKGGKFKRTPEGLVPS